MLETEVKFSCPTTGDLKIYTYQHSEKHRDGNRGKSQWTISVDEEAYSFQISCDGGWTVGACGWGLHIVDGAIFNLGFDREAGDVFLAKFDKHSDFQWHGYPCDYKKNNQCPTPQILQEWVAHGYLRLAQMRKITRGQRCAI